jgi:hypothetical protein
MDNDVRAVQRLERLRAHEAVRVGDNAHQHVRIALKTIKPKPA